MEETGAVAAVQVNGAVASKATVYGYEAIAVIVVAYITGISTTHGWCVIDLLGAKLGKKD